jgi:aryl-phospho-beta-D-glucosidase BglC (GH1 family)
VLSGVTVVAASPVPGEGSEPTLPSGGETQDAQTIEISLPPFPADAFGYGIQIQGAANSGADPAAAVAAAKKLGMNWIKQQVRWSEIEPGPGEFNWDWIDGVINDANKAGLYVMLSVVTAPEWSRAGSGGGKHGPPDNYEEYGRFVGELVDRYKGKIHAIEVWNEQNLDREWQSPQGLNAADYVRLLQTAQREIKARDPSVIVISGALSPTGGWVEPDGRVTAIDDFAFLQDQLDAGLLSYSDCIGAHHNGINFPPDKSWDEGYQDPSATFRGPFDNAHHSWSFKSTLQGYHDMIKQAGGQQKLCVTEFGWATAEGFGGTPQGFEFANDNSLAEQAEWDVQAFQLQRDWGTTWIAYLWNLNYANLSRDPADPNAPYSIVDFDGVPRPAYGALEQMEKP